MVDRPVSLSERLRPKDLQDLALGEKTIARLQTMLDVKEPVNMLFYGPPGTGKTSTAKMFVEARGQLGCLELDGSLQTGVSEVRTLVDRFASCYPLDPGMKLCFIDEADYLSQNAQASLRGIIERYDATCRFIFAVNDLSKMHEAIRSRTVCIDFAVAVVSPNVRERVQKRMEDRLTKLGVQFDAKRLDLIFSVYFPDLRRVVKQLEFEFGSLGTSVPNGT
ncbi:AAA family ATPase [Bradyrhizobium canariense]|uniref:AAA family ATPase n=1 Tax=Bradyrhizobium canariense TaxID=255045 RepID=UPI001B8A10AB|nr:AAA family ATPase [Bradyrhizobium canariense]MBR0955685.1 AAA family ATPase [Bradyrhizobium canariense]